jgi:putative ABC transport system ATP-binding protein
MYYEIERGNVMIQIKNLVKIYNKGKTNEFCALKGIDLSIEEGEMVAIIGKSGAGKSTLLHILAAIDSYDKGSYLVDGVSVGDLKEKDRARFRNQKIGIVMQDYALIDEYTIEENVQIPLIFGKVKGNDVRREKIMTALENVGLAELAKKPVRQLSGGQKQRVAIARALVNNPTFLLADEPTGALDSKTSGEIMDVFEKLNQGGKTVIIVTHDMEVAARCGRVIEISDGEIV